jgi:DEAD/DEAH box helicase domain-containing protein
MLSLNQAIEIKESILAYLKATFSFQDKEVHKAFYDFINHPKEGLFKGPYLSLKIPFVKALEEEVEKIPLTIKPNWLPYDHQVKSWHRLSTKDQKAKPTIITTGTGSGKTESFMYPVLDYCYRNLSRPGIKVIILYPMNALATDQAKRLAEAIYEDERLRGKITAGLFIGEGKNAGKYPKSMGKDNIIENRESIISSPPDILLTNFKMLDYGLMKSNYNDLWLGNYKDPSLLKFLVLDELHTYDGAQGTDVANLIRRLKLKLSIPENHLCPIGTSATIGSGSEAPQLLSDYASKIFGEHIAADCIVTENRIPVEEYFGPDEKLEMFIPRAQALKDIKPVTGEGYDKYLDRQVVVWQVNKSNLAKDLLRLKIVKDLVLSVGKGKGIQTLKSLIRILSDINDNFKNVPQWDDENHFNPKEAMVQSLFALISEAKMIDTTNGRKSPFLYTQTQLWIRELSGLLRHVKEEPSFTWKESIDQKEEELGLPPWYCRECGASGWLGLKHDNKERFEQDVKDVYSKFFTNHKHVYFANRTSWYSQQDAVQTGYEANDVFRKYVFNRNLEFHERPEEGRTDITAFRKLDRNGYNDHVCPECNTRNSVSIIGTRIATLSSIAVSQTLSTDLDDQNEQERKVLAFTNSVQDAAHQAGFVEARNYRFTFRSSLQRVINQQDKSICLEELSNKFIEYWKEHADETGQLPLDAYFYRFYPTDYLGKSSPRDYNESGRYLPNFIQEFDERIKWNVYEEFGYNALIGRTLEKTGSSGVYIPDEDLQKAWSKVEPWLDANEPSGTIAEKDFMVFLNLILHRIRTRGAISHPFLNKYRDRDLSLWDLNWMRDSRHFLNRKFGPRTRIPKLLTYEKDSRGLLDSTLARTTNWYHQYYKKSFQQASNYPEIINEFYQKVLISLAESGVLDTKNSHEKLNFALNPAKIYVSQSVTAYECNTCGDQVNLGHSVNNLGGGKCLTYRCSGEYTRNDELLVSNYYQLVYNRNRSPRIYAADHTGLLERKQRELLEIDFKTRPKFNSKNALVATSTLEMGIDIGSLNTAYNNSIPPLPSNFLQRIGRAGRSTGSALIVNFAKNQAHDLFYFKEPLDMMAGEVSTPGCYLAAKEILKRHFFAFCIDSWAKSNPAENSIPVTLKYLRLETTDLNGQDFFMNRILNYIKANEPVLYSLFKEGYKNDIEAAVFDSLYEELVSDSFYLFHKRIFSNLKNEIFKIKGLQKEIDERIKELKLGKEDPERIKLEKEKKNLGGLEIAIRKRNTLEHLTNVGALPNYAFPETGVTLSAKVLGNKAVASNKPPINKDFEIVRSASQALSEFAPDNYFYSQGYKFLITGVNTFDWSDKANFHKKRFCSNCDHIEIAETSSKGNCPKCGHESWGASSNVHTYAKLTAVKSFNNQTDATLNDAGDDRDSITYNIQRHFNFNSSQSYGSYAMKEIPFGIEFVKDVSLTEVNLGRADISNARKILIKEEEVPTHGFVTCKHCGKSSSNFHQRNYKYHYGYCKHKEVSYNGIPDDVFEEVFYFREIQTESLKILLPVQEFNGDSEVKMFKAGIELGLKKYFQGNPQHIRLVDYCEYNHITGKFDRYLVLYDSIPGGTGYLEKLFSASEFSKLLMDAYVEIRDCTCQFDGKDGCYRCIYSYSNQYHQLELSRSTAEKRFHEIVKRSEDWESRTIGLGNLTNQGHIEESELEERFIRSLKKLAVNDKKWKIEEFNDDGTVTYLLSYDDGTTKFSYHIRSQVNLGPNDGIKFHTRTDFLAICTAFEKKDEETIDLISIPRIAIYMDGYQYHASKEHNRFEKDLMRRQAIKETDSHISWTLTWDDIELFDSSLNGLSSDNSFDFLERRLREEEFRNTRSRLLRATSRKTLRGEGLTNNFSRLLEVLKNQYSQVAIRKELSFYLSFFQKKLFEPSYAPDEITTALEQIAFDNYISKHKTLNALVPASIFDTSLQLFDLNVASNIELGKAYYSFSLHSLDHIDKKEWNTFWTLFNIIQFFEEQEHQVTASVAKNDLLGHLSETIKRQFEPVYHKIIDTLIQSGELTKEEDEVHLYSLVDKNGNIIAEADFILSSQKLVVEPFSEEDAKIFKENGYTQITPAEIKNIDL